MAYKDGNDSETLVKFKRINEESPTRKDKKNSSKETPKSLHEDSKLS